METVEAKRSTYEKLYFTLWETARRYSSFARFRVIGKSHDERMIPMLEVGDGAVCIFCLAGVDGSDHLMPSYLVQMAQEYCQSYECDWLIDDCYHVRRLLDHVRICFIPLLNPDGCEICAQGYTAIRNPIFRQMLRMQNFPHDEFYCNARGIDLGKNFPTNFYMRRQIHQEPASENETKALIHILQEYQSVGLLSFGLSEKRIIYCRQNNGYACNRKSYHMARHLQKKTGYHLEKNRWPEEQSAKAEISTGSPEQFYAEVLKQPSLKIETPFLKGGTAEDSVTQRKKEYREICLLPLNYLLLS